MVAKKSSKIAAIIIAFMMLFAMMPQSAMPVYAEPGDAGLILVENGDASNIKGGKGSSTVGGVYFGRYPQSSDGKGGFIIEPIKWRVLRNEDKHMLLFSDKNIDGGIYDDTNSDYYMARMSWERANIRAIMNDSMLNKAFHSKESIAVKTTEIVSKYWGPSSQAAVNETTYDQLFLLSIDDIRKTEFGFKNDVEAWAGREAENTDYTRFAKVSTSEKGCGRYWLRNQGNGAGKFSGVDFDGSIADGWNKDSYSAYAVVGIRPAFHLVMSKVAMISSATGKKSSMGIEGINPAALERVENNANDEWKVTLRDDGSKNSVGNGHSEFKVDSVRACDDKMIKMTYSGAATGDNEYISVFIKNSTGQITHYGRVAKCKSTSGTAWIGLNGILDNTSKLYVFNEQYNGDYETDYTSDFHEITLPQPTGHNYGPWKYMNDISHNRTCSYDDWHSEIEEHTWDAGKVTRKATTSVAGVKTYTCDVCKGNKTESIPKATIPATSTIRNTIANTVATPKYKDVIYDAVNGATDYDIAYKHRNSGKWVIKSVGKTTRARINGLSVNGLYEIKVRAKKGETATHSAAIGEWSPTVYRYFYTTQKIRLKSASKGSFTMSWAKNPAATGYQVMFTTNKNGAGAAKNINTVGKNATSFTKKGLKSGQTYYVQVRTLKKVGSNTYVGNISNPVPVKVK